MAYNNPGPSEDYYDDGPAAKEGQESASQEAEEHKGDETALLPKSILMGKEFKPGEEVVLEIVRMLDDQVEVKYASEKGEGEESGEKYPEKATMPGGEGESEMSSLMG